jgi:hypothetical protein
MGPAATLPETISTSLVTWERRHHIPDMGITTGYRLDIEPRPQSPGYYDWIVYRRGILVLKSPQPYHSQASAEMAGRAALERLQAEDIQWREE